jgi:hypothetical protein
MLTVADFFAFARERELTRINKESGAPRPWTDDPIIRGNYFCNVFREDDKTTRWFRESIRDPLRDTCRVAIATIAFRWFNYIPTGELIKDLLVRGDLHGLASQIATILRPLQQRGDKLFTGAFIVKSPNGTDKLSGILSCLDVAPGVLADGPDQWSLQAYHQLLQRIPFLGPFMAYQIVCDLRFTAVLESALDINSWTAPGPGSARGLAWLDAGGELFNYNSASGQATMVQRMQVLLEESRYPLHWPTGWRPWELSTVQHTLCEFDKYQRAKAGERMKRRYP